MIALGRFRGQQAAAIGSYEEVYGRYRLGELGLYPGEEMAEALLGESCGATSAQGTEGDRRLARQVLSPLLQVVPRQLPPAPAMLHRALPASWTPLFRPW